MVALDTRRQPYFKRFWAELGRMGGEHDAFIKVIIAERLIKSVVLIVLAITLEVGEDKGWLAAGAAYAQNQLNLNVGHGIITQLLLRALLYVGNFNQVDLVATAAVIYALLEATEGIGLAMRRRWAEYLTVIATGILIPYEMYEVFHHATVFKVAALLLNVAVVGYLTYRKRLFVGV